MFKKTVVFILLVAGCSSSLSPFHLEALCEEKHVPEEVDPSEAPVEGSCVSDDCADAESFWTEVIPSPDTRMIYVSASEGDDDHSGRSPSEPVRTIAKGISLLRDNSPDWLLLKRGDVWYESLREGENSSWERSGRSETEPMVIRDYGEGSKRPQIIVDDHGLASYGERSHLYVMGLRITAATYGRYGILVLHKGGENILIEDTLVEGFNPNIAVSPQEAGSVFSDLKLRRNISVDAGLDGWTQQGSQGLYAQNVDGLLIEENIFDHNARSMDPDEEISSVFGHNIYLNRGNTNVTLRDNIVSNGGSHGIKAMSGGTLHGNLFLHNPIHILLGSGDENLEVQKMFSASVKDNVILGSRMIDAEKPRSFGIDMMNLDGVVIQDNIFGNSVTGKGAIWLFSQNLKDVDLAHNTLFKWTGVLGDFALSREHDVENVQIRNNLMDNACNVPIYHVDGRDPPYDFGHPELSLELMEELDYRIFGNRYHHDDEHDYYVPFMSVDGYYRYFPDWQPLGYDTDVELNPCTPEGTWDTMTISAYMSTLGLEPSLEAFVDGARSRAPGEWDARFSACAANRYFRDTRESIVSTLPM